MPDATETRADYFDFQPVQTRWNDNDLYGHVNNVVYYAYVDTAVNKFLVEAGGFDPHTAPVIGICPESHCNFLNPVAYPEKLEVGLRVGKLGNSSVRYEVAVFKDGEQTPAATGYFVHVFVDRENRRPVTIPDAIRAALAGIAVEGDVRNGTHG